MVLVAIKCFSSGHCSRQTVADMSSSGTESTVAQLPPDFLPLLVSKEKLWDNVAQVFLQAT